MITDAIVTLRWLRPEKMRWMVVVLVERNKGMNGVNSSVLGVNHNDRVRTFGSRGSRRAWTCRTERTWEDKDFKASNSWISCIFSAYFRRRAHSWVFGSLSNDFQAK